MNLENEKNLAQKLSDDIVDYILKNNLVPGDKLPNELILSELMGVGRSSIREAMKLLASRNVVEIRQGSGTYVSKKQGIPDDPLGLTFITDKEKLIHDLIEVRFLLEPSIAGLAARNATSDDILKIESLCDEIEHLILAKKNHVQKDIEFHKAIAMSSNNVVVPRIIPIINTSIELFITATDSSLRDETIESHRDITNAIKQGDVLAAQDAMYLHLLYNKKRILKNPNIIEYFK